MSTLLLQGLALHSPAGRVLLESTDLVLDAGPTALVGANGVGKSTLLRALAGEIEPAAGRLHATMPAWRVAGQGRNEEPVGLALQRLEQALRAADKPTRRAVARVLPACLPADLSRDSLSGGEALRLALAEALLAPGRFLLLDEPSAHLDADARGWLCDWLLDCPAPVLFVSHDPALLRCAVRILEMADARLFAYGTGWEEYRRLRCDEQSSVEAALREARRAERRLQAASQRARERADRRAAQGRRERERGSQGPMLLDYRQGRAEGARSRDQRGAAQRLDQARQAVQEGRQRLLTGANFQLGLPEGLVHTGQRLLSARGLRIESGQRVVLDGLDLDLVGRFRLAVTGPNGSGKSRLLRVLAGVETPACGSVQRHVASWVLIDQHARLAEGERLIDVFQRAQPAQAAGPARETLAKFLFFGDQVFQLASTLSAGERLRLQLACLLGGEAAPSLLLLDEPDNHLDLPSRAVVEQALAQYPGGLLVVSHSEDFLAAIGCGERLRLGQAVAVREPVSARHSAAGSR